MRKCGAKPHMACAIFVNFQILVIADVLLRRVLSGIESTTMLHVVLSQGKVQIQRATIDVMLSY
jgi:hypothetical protein